MDNNITLQTKQMIDNLKAVCTNYGLGNASSEYKIITEVFLYKFLNDKFLAEAKKVRADFGNKSSAEIETALAKMSADEYELFFKQYRNCPFHAVLVCRESSGGPFRRSGAG